MVTKLTSGPRGFLNYLAILKLDLYMGIEYDILLTSLNEEAIQCV